MNPSTPHSFIDGSADITIDDVPRVGRKYASLGEMVRERAALLKSGEHDEPKPSDSHRLWHQFFPTKPIGLVASAVMAQSHRPVLMVCPPAA